MRVIYDITYALRGKSGIPKDTRSVAAILCSIDDVDTTFVISPKRTVSRCAISFDLKAIKDSRISNSVFSSDSKGLKIFLIISLIRNFFQSLSLQPYVKLEKIIQRNVDSILRLAGIEKPTNEKILNISMFRLSYAARFVRPKFLGAFRIRAKKDSYFIQQHIDPIKVVGGAKHIVRLHDVIPITHPYFFSEKAQLAFNRGFASLIKNKEIIWIMDTHASKKELLELFGLERIVEVIPCEVGHGLNPQKAIVSVKNKTKNKKKNKITFLCVNTIEPRKNVSLIISSFLFSLHENEKKCLDELIIVGSYGWMEEELIIRLRNGYYGKQVKFIEQAEEFQIEELFKQADFVISASEAEGFGLPPLEGMLFGCLPIVSDIPQHRETMDTKAIYFNLNKESLSGAISEARKVSIAERQKFAIEAHRYIQDKFSHEVLKENWGDLLQKLKSREIQS